MEGKQRRRARPSNEPTQDSVGSQRPEVLTNFRGRKVARSRPIERNDFCQLSNFENQKFPIWQFSKSEIRDFDFLRFRVLRIGFSSIDDRERD